MSRNSYGEQMQRISAHETMLADYFDARTAAPGARVPYRDETDATDDQVWGDASRMLARRGLVLYDDGNGYVVSVSDEQIEALYREAGEHGDTEQAAICQRALDGDAAARRECARVISDAAAQR